LQVLVNFIRAEAIACYGVKQAIAAILVLCILLESFTKSPAVNDIGEYLDGLTT